MVTRRKRVLLIRARKAAGFTQEEAAYRLDVDRSTIGRWESGETEPLPWLRPKLAKLLGITFARLEELLLAVETEKIDPSAVGGTTASAGLSQLEILRRGLNTAITDNAMTAASLDEWEQTVFQHGHTTRDRVPSLLLADLSADLVELHQALARCRSSSALQRLTRVLAQMAGLVCLTLVKIDEHTAFRDWARTASLAAGEAGDRLVHSWVRAQEAYGHYYSGHFIEAVHVAEHAQVLSARVWSVGFVLAAALEARAQAALGQGEATRSALQRAEACLSHLEAGSIGTSAFDYNEAQLRFHEGNAFTHLHDTNAAWQAQQRALLLCPASDYMDRTMTQLDRAHCLAHDGDMTGAVAIMVETVAPLSDQQRQGIIAARARQTIAILPKQHQTLPAVRDLHDLLIPAETKNHV